MAAQRATGRERLVLADQQFGVRDDYLTRTAIARSNFENAAAETKYVFTDTDTADDAAEPLHGSSLYTITFAPGQLPPVNGFWSLTATTSTTSTT